MRIVCPNCNAQYEIDGSLLPAEGREVQCSACGTVWFQNAPAPDAPTDASPAPAMAEPAAEAPVDDLAPATETPLEELAEPDTPPADETTPTHAAPDPDPDDADEDDDAEPTEAPPLNGAPKPVDDKVLGILREEAEFEQQQRARDKGGLETQPELGLMGAAPWPSNAAQTRKAAPEAQPAPAPTSERSPAFPDIEDISASLEPKGQGRNYTRSARDSAPAATAPAEATGGGFMRGLIWPIAIALVLVALYLAAPALSGMMPPLAPVLAGYVMAVDGLRDAVAGLFGR